MSWDLKDKQETGVLDGACGGPGCEWGAQCTQRPKQRRGLGQQPDHRGLVPPETSKGALKGRGQGGTSSEGHVERSPQLGRRMDRVEGRRAAHWIVGTGELTTSQAHRWPPRRHSTVTPKQPHLSRSTSEAGHWWDFKILLKSKRTKQSPIVYNESDVTHCNYHNEVSSGARDGEKGVSAEPHPTRVPGRRTSSGQTQFERHRRAGQRWEQPRKSENILDQTTTAGLSSSCHIFPTPIFSLLKNFIEKEKPKVTWEVVPGAPAGPARLIHRVAGTGAVRSRLTRDIQRGLRTAAREGHRPQGPGLWPGLGPGTGGQEPPLPDTKTLPGDAWGLQECPGAAVTNDHRLGLNFTVS